MEIDRFGFKEFSLNLRVLHQFDNYFLKNCSACMTTEKPSKFSLKIVLISVLLLSLATLSVSAFVFKDKILDQNKNETIKVSVQNQNDITNTNAADGPAKVTSTTQNLLNTPLLIIQGSGYGK